MDDGQQVQNPNAAVPPQCQYHQHHRPNLTSFPPLPRDAHHYDPVHNTESWHQANAAGAQTRSQYAAAMNAWSPGPFVPMNGWQAFGEAPAAARGPDGPAFGQQAGFMGMPNSPWTEMRGFEPPPFGYTSYVGSGVLPEPNSPGRNPQLALPQTPTVPPMQQPLRPGTAAALHSHVDYIRQIAHASSSSASSQEEALRIAVRTARLREGRERPCKSSHSYNRVHKLTSVLVTQVPRTYEPPHSHTSLDTSRPRRRNANDWDSGDDDDDAHSPLSEVDSDRAGFLYSGMDEERHMAAVRGAIAAGKKIPSKEFIASLERVDPKDIKEGDRSKCLHTTTARATVEQLN